jgi:hypothetical protein
MNTGDSFAAQYSATDSIKQLFSKVSGSCSRLLAEYESNQFKLDKEASNQNKSGELIQSLYLCASEPQKPDFTVLFETKKFIQSHCAAK